MIKFNPVVRWCRHENGFSQSLVRIVWHHDHVLSRRGSAGGGHRPFAEKHD